MTKVIAITNQKGGVGKTSTTVNLGAALVRQGFDVLLIDLDSQANLTMALGFQSPDDMEFTISNVLYKAVHWEPEFLCCSMSLVWLLAGRRTRVCA